jgi:hypothetical protein
MAKKKGSAEMKELTVDLGSVSDGRLEPGTYDLEIVAVKSSESQAGNPCLDIQFREVNDEGRHFERIPVMDTTLWRLKRLVAAAGLDADSKWSISDLQQDLVGSVVKAEIVMGTLPNGDERQQAKSFSPVK